MKKHFIALSGLILAFSMMMAGCGEASNPSYTVNEGNDTGAIESSGNQNNGEEAASDVPQAGSEYLVTRFGAAGEPFFMYLEDNSTAEAIARYVGTSSWQLPIYSYDESDVMEYYDIPRRYEIPDNSETVTEAHAGDVFYSDPNRIILYYADAEISEEYTLIGRFDATEEFISAVVNNPVLEGWGNQLVIISSEE